MGRSCTKLDMEVLGPRKQLIIASKHRPIEWRAFSYISVCHEIGPDGRLAKLHDPSSPPRDDHPLVSAS